MEIAADQLSRTLETLAAGLSRGIVALHEERDPTIPERYGRGWRGEWEREVAQRLRYLAQAVAVQRPTLFVESMIWSRSVHVSRDLDAADIERSLICTRDLLHEELPDYAIAETLPAVDEAITRIVAEQPGTVEPGHAAGASPRRAIVLHFLEALLEGRREDAIKIVEKEIDDGATVREIYEQVLLPALVEIGILWQRNEVGVAAEHYATAATLMAMSRLRPHFPEVPSNGRRLLALGVGGDLHEIGIRAVSEFFEMDGWDVHYLGANVPADDVVAAIAEREPHLVLLSAQSTLNVRSIAEVIGAIHEHGNGNRPVTLVGGLPFNLIDDLWSAVGADGFGRSPSEALEVGNRLVSES